LIYAIVVADYFASSFDFADATPHTPLPLLNALFRCLRHYFHAAIRRSLMMLPD